MRIFDYIVAFGLAIIAHATLAGLYNDDKLGSSNLEAVGSFEVPQAFDISLDEGTGAPTAAQSDDKSETSENEPPAEEHKVERSIDDSPGRTEEIDAPADVPKERHSEQTASEVARLMDSLEVPENTATVEPEAPAPLIPAPRTKPTTPKLDPRMEKLLSFKPKPKPSVPKRKAALPTRTKRAPSQPSLTGVTKRQTGSPDPGALKTYSATLRRWVARHKQYPNAARRKKLQGSVRLWIKIDRNGVVIATRVTKASGVAPLDQATASLPRRASPFPPIPESVGRSTFSFSITLRYSMR